MPSDKYRLGRECTFALEGVILNGVREVGVRRTTREVDATGWQHSVESKIVTHRSYEFDVVVLYPGDAAKLKDAEEHGKVVTVTTTNGLREVEANFTVHDSTADEGVDDAIAGRFTLRQWGHPKPDE